jgi:hypothetical protein
VRTARGVVGDLGAAGLLVQAAPACAAGRSRGPPGAGGAPHAGGVREVVGGRLGRLAEVAAAERAAQIRARLGSKDMRRMIRLDSAHDSTFDIIVGTPPAVERWYKPACCVRGRCKC